MFTYELSRRLAGTGVTINVLMPGFVAGAINPVNRSTELHCNRFSGRRRNASFKFGMHVHNYEAKNSFILTHFAAHRGHILMSMYLLKNRI
jgi:NAD(P)-dependent dehydrogenase (short-subunit alcohol dehydrogenase family)